MTSNPIVLTGLGLVLPCGDGLDAARQAWAAQASAFSDLPPTLGGGRGAACLAFNPSGIIPPMQLRRLDRPSRFAWVAAHQAFQDAGLDPKPLGESIAIAVGTLTGGSEASEAFMRPYLQRGPEGASPMLFPNCVANAAAGHVALAFGLKGPSTTQLEREGGTLAALDQACRWLRAGMAKAVLVLGTDGLFPLQVELLARTGLSRQHGEPRWGGGGFLPGEGAQAFLLERAEDAKARGARVRAQIGACSSAAPHRVEPEALAQALLHAVEGVAPVTPTRWIGGSRGSRTFDALEANLQARCPHLPAPAFPKLLWGEFGGAGGQLLAAALLEPASSVLVTAPASQGAQWACRLDAVQP